MIVNGVELKNINVADADEMERFEAACDKVTQKMNALTATEHRRSELIRIQCRAVFEFFNEVFGEGTDKKVFGEQTNLVTCIEAFGDVTKAVNEDDRKMADIIRSKYQPKTKSTRSLIITKAKDTDESDM